MWEKWFAWFPVNTNKGWRWLTTVNRKYVPCFGTQNGMKWYYKDLN